MKKKKPLISLVIPMRNEFENLERLFNTLNSELDKLSNNYDFELIVTDNASEDDTWKSLEKQDCRYPLKAYRFNRNVGVQRSILFGLKSCSGDAAIQLDADLQDPPALIEQFLEKWDEGFLDVYGVRKKRSENKILNSFRVLGYAIVDILSETRFPRNVGDFRLLDRRVLNALFELKTHEPYLRGMVATLGFKSVGIPYDRDPRIKGKSKIGIIRLVKIGVSAIFNHSTVPLRFASVMGLFFLFLSLVLGAILIWIKFVDPTVPQGYTSTNLLILFSLGLNSFFLGILGEYLLRIYKILKSDSQPIVQSSWQRNVIFQIQSNSTSQELS